MVSSDCKVLVDDCCFNLKVFSIAIFWIMMLACCLIITEEDKQYLPDAILTSVGVLLVFSNAVFIVKLLDEYIDEEEDAAAERGQHTQEGVVVALPTTFDQRVSIARFAMRNLPPVKSFAQEDVDRTDNGARSSGDDDDAAPHCSVCMEAFKIGELIQPFGICNHEFHSSCLNSCLLAGTTTCPICRKDFATPN